MGVRVEDLADDAFCVLDGYGIESAHLVGISLGGFLSQLMALKHPQRVKSLTLIASERLADNDPTMPGIDPLERTVKRSGCIYCLLYKSMVV
ncbi:MAG: alpha/beta fold hydrolase [Cyanosarcina radialis HA8281-LM2]|nr:alpha/beta fold hydrolase [Cyanosarcina radialis HA8281-LM2]